METIIFAQPFPTSFAQGVASAKLLKGQFNASDKTWRIDLTKTSIDGVKLSEMSEADLIAWLKGRKLKIANPAATSAAQSYRGQASMDAEDSHF